MCKWFEHEIQAQAQVKVIQSNVYRIDAFHLKYIVDADKRRCRFKKQPCFGPLLYQAYELACFRWAREHWQHDRIRAHLRNLVYLFLGPLKQWIDPHEQFRSPQDLAYAGHVFHCVARNYRIEVTLPRHLSVYLKVNHHKVHPGILCDAGSNGVICNEYEVHS